MKDRDFIDAMALVVSDSFISPEIFSTVVEQVSREKEIKESDVASIMLACYSYHLWGDRARKDFLKDYINDVLEG